MMIINFKSRYIKPNEFRYYPHLYNFHFYNNYQCIYTKRLVRYTMGNKEFFLRIAQDKLSYICNTRQYICIISDKNIFENKLVFCAELIDNDHIFNIRLVTYIKNKNTDQLIIDLYHTIYNLQEFEDINFYGKVITSKQLEIVKNQFFNIIESKKLINAL